MRKGRSGRKNRISRAPASIVEERSLSVERKGLGTEVVETTPSERPDLLARGGHEQEEGVGPLEQCQAFEEQAMEEAPRTPRVEVPSVPAQRAHRPSFDPPTPAQARDDLARREDDRSIPPVEQGLHESFFSESEHDIHSRDLESEHDANDARIRKTLPHVVARRQRLSRVVTWVAVGACAVCALALGRALVPGRDGSSTSSPETSFATTSKMDVREAAIPARAPAAPAEIVPTPGFATQLVDVPLPVEAAPVTSPEPPRIDAERAMSEKVVARQALEQGKVAEAVAAGERSVSADPTDGESWLLLGAAYQEQGNLKDARRCYRACIDEGKRGPRNECGQMLR